MSDAFSARPWQLWQPNDLGRFDEPEPELQPEIYDAEDGDGVDEQQQQLERLQQQMRKEAQSQGYNEGYQQGVTEGQKAGYDAGFQQGLADAQQQQAPLQARMQQLVT